MNDMLNDLKQIVSEKKSEKITKAHFRLTEGGFAMAAKEEFNY